MTPAPGAGGGPRERKEEDNQEAGTRIRLGQAMDATASPTRDEVQGFWDTALRGWRAPGPALLTLRSAFQGEVEKAINSGARRSTGNGSGRK